MARSKSINTLYLKANKRIKEFHFRPAPAWGKEESSPLSVAARLEAAAEFWAFDSIYFPKSVYKQGYFPNPDFHSSIIDICEGGGIVPIIGFRESGKTTLAKKYFVWRYLTGKDEVSGTLSETLPISRNILKDLRTIMQNNPRIRYDFKVKFLQKNKDQIEFITENERFPSFVRRVMAFSEGRSVRGYTQEFSRPTSLLCDDIETRKSSFSAEQVRKRKGIIVESFKSCSNNSNPLLLILGNNFDKRSVMNIYKTQLEQGTLEAGVRVMIIPAWDEKNKRPSWYQRYKAITEIELRRELIATADDEWFPEYQMQPSLEDGRAFPKAYFDTYDNLPDDARGILYTDPNLSLKGKGDTTAATVMFYSPTTDIFYIERVRCKSFSDSNDLLEAVLNLRFEGRKLPGMIGMDGNVSQEATWTNHVRNFAKIKKQPFPAIVYKRYNVNDLVKSASLVWTAGRIKFRAGLINTTEGDIYISQVFPFSKKVPGKKDDAPDTIVCLIEMFYELGYCKKPPEEIPIHRQISPFDEYEW